MVNALCRNRLGVRLQGPRPKFARKDGGEGGSHPSNVHDHVYAIGTINFTGAPSGRLIPLRHARTLATALSRDAGSNSHRLTVEDIALQDMASPPPACPVAGSQ